MRESIDRVCSAPTAAENTRRYFATGTTFRVATKRTNTAEYRRAIIRTIHFVSILPKNTELSVTSKCEFAHLNRKSLQVSRATRVVSYRIGSATLEKVWSGRPGSNRRRPAWEFSTEMRIFSFDNRKLAPIC